MYELATTHNIEKVRTKHVHCPTFSEEEYKYFDPDFIKLITECCEIKRSSRPSASDVHQKLLKIHERKYGPVTSVEKS
jgi:hypothetical protein